MPNEMMDLHFSLFWSFSTQTNSTKIQINHTASLSKRYLANIKFMNSKLEVLAQSSGKKSSNLSLSQPHASLTKTHSVKKWMLFSLSPQIKQLAVWTKFIYEWSLSLLGTMLWMIMNKHSLANESKDRFSSLPQTKAQSTSNL